MIKIKRVFEPLDSEDGIRILVDRLWPRGVSKEGAGIDLWLKEIAPSDELRKWFNHEEDKWEEFGTRYQSELRKNPVLHELKDILNQHQTLTLVYAAKDETHNNAVMLRQFLESLGS